MSAKRKSAKKTASSKTTSGQGLAKKIAAKKTPARKTAVKKTAPVRATKAARKAAATRTAPRAKKKARMPAGPEVVHWEIQSQSPDALHRFYADVFGWEVNAKNPMNYGLVSSGGENGIDGGIGGSPSPGSRVLVYANVADINAMLEKIESVGGKTVMPRTDVGAVIMALYTDPDGNVMGIIEG